MENITFIIPTIGRNTLLNSINCLKNQTVQSWKAIIIFDGIKSNICNNDNRIKIVEINKTGVGSNSAGNVRNYGISLVDTDWIAFLDDDDLIANDYIESFYNELKLYPSIDVLIFRMTMENRIDTRAYEFSYYILLLLPND
jgi:glycosyltransferase involved in cell wall biosynthesis